MSILIIIAASLLAGFYLLILLSVCGGPFLSLVAEIKGRLGQQVFFNKFARQMARMSLLYTLLWLILTLAAAAWWIRFQGFSAANLQLMCLPELSLPQVFTPFLAVLAILIYLSYYCFREKLKDKQAILVVMLIVVCLGIGGFLFTGLNTAVQYFHDPSPSLLPVTWYDLLSQSDNIFFWILLFMVVISALGGAGALGVAYLLKRRNKDDYGRDYYQFAVPAAARWSLIFPVQIIFFFWVWWSTGKSFQLDKILQSAYMPLAVSAILLILAAICWIMIIRSRTPMRMKATIISSTILAWLALSSACLGYARVLGAFS